MTAEFIMENPAWTFENNYFCKQFEDKKQVEQLFERAEEKEQNQCGYAAFFIRKPFLSLDLETDKWYNKRMKGGH